MLVALFLGYCVIGAEAYEHSSARGFLHELPSYVVGIGYPVLGLIATIISIIAVIRTHGHRAITILHSIVGVAWCLMVLVWFIITGLVTKTTAHVSFEASYDWSLTAIILSVPTAILLMVTTIVATAVTNRDKEEPSAVEDENTVDNQNADEIEDEVEDAPSSDPAEVD